MKKRPCLTITFILIVVLAACGGLQNVKDPFAAQAYRTLSTSYAAYDSLWGAFVAMNKQGLIKAETFAEGQRLARIFFNDWKKATQAMIDYEQSKITHLDADAKVKFAQAGLAELTKYLQTQGALKPIL